MTIYIYYLTLYSLMAYNGKGEGNIWVYKVKKKKA